jgi:hypothetical protein
LRGRDAAEPVGPRIAEVAVRLDAPNGGTPSASVLAFRARVTGVGPEEVLPAVDPLVAQPPEGSCALRDVTGAARAIGAQGGRVELEHIADLALGFGRVDIAETLELTGSSVLRPSPRVYLDSGVGGVIAEAGPIDLVDSPELLLLGEGGPRVPLPALPRIENIDGSPLPAKPVFSADRDLVLSVSGPPRTFVELRPFVATWALACPVTAHPSGGNRVVVPAAELARLATLRVPVKIEAVARESHLAQLPERDGNPARAVQGAGTGSTVRLTLEVRSSAVVDLQP